MPPPLRVLFVTSECAPWVKTGGLADVSAALPPALEVCGVDVRVLMPLYGSVRPQLAHSRLRAWLPAHGPLPAANLVEAPLPSGTPAWLIEAPELYERDGGPYVDAAGRDWPDNALRFGALARVAADLAHDAFDLGWVPDVIHAHDWQAGLAPAYVRFGGDRVPTLMTIHNLAFQGLFPADTLRRPRPAAGKLVDRRRGVLRSTLVPQGRAVLRRRDHHGEPHLRRGDPARAARHGPAGSARGSRATCSPASSTASTPSRGTRRATRIAASLRRRASAGQGDEQARAAGARSACRRSRTCRCSRW